MDCPFCSEEISDKAVKCKHCGEFLGEQAPVDSGGGGALKIVLMILAIVIGVFCIIPIIIAITVPNLVPARKQGNESAAIGALKTIGTAQSLYREADKENDGNLDYGTLEELANAGTTGLIDMVLGSGTKNGYLFEVTYGSSTSEFIWFATANPALPGTTGDRYFATNHEGVTFYSTTGPIPMSSIECTMPQGVKVVGR